MAERCNVGEHGGDLGNLAFGFSRWNVQDAEALLVEEKQTLLRLKSRGRAAHESDID